MAKKLLIGWLLLTGGAGKAFGAQPGVNSGRNGNGHHNPTADALQHMPFPNPAWDDKPFTPADQPPVVAKKPSKNPGLTLNHLALAA